MLLLILMLVIEKEMTTSNDTDQITFRLIASNGGIFLPLVSKIT